ncbi:NepR family anti-sigma factor [Novosphingobium humi]|nr:NepR family anti-sigma factor [Novosphingobium humi]WJS98748.1 NepR family anti-sigma factor [Novosphingobium humi]
MNREQKPRSADLSGDSIAGSPIPGEDGAKPEAGPETAKGDKKDGGMDEAPPWAAPLRDMYQQVVEEPLPDFLSDLLSRLDRDAE